MSAPIIMAPVAARGLANVVAERALGAGAQEIWVSNHGGHQLDGGPAGFDSLQIVAGQEPTEYGGGNMFSKRLLLEPIW